MSGANRRNPRDRDASRGEPELFACLGSGLALRVRHRLNPVPINAAAQERCRRVARRPHNPKSRASARPGHRTSAKLGGSASVVRGPQPFNALAARRARPHPPHAIAANSPPKNARRAPRAVDAPAPADLRQDADGQDHHARRRTERHDRQRQTKNPGQGGHPAGPAAPHLRGKAARGWTHFK